jgi:hypothetical protein
MKKLILIPFLFICLSISAATYYVATDGDDGNPGTLAQPWATWGKAFNATEIQPGDTVYFRGGVYQKDINEGLSYWFYPSRSSGGSGYNITRGGNASAWVYYWGYPTDIIAGNYPILDCTGDYNPLYTGGTWGIRASGAANYIHLKNLKIRNVSQYPHHTEYGEYGEAIGMAIAGNPFILENLEVYNILGTGIEIRGGADFPNYSYIINCDVHDCCDSLSTEYPGNDGYGFDHSGGGRLYYKNCRAWLCGDYGFANYTMTSADSNQYTEYDGCWAFNNGMLEGVGHGFCMGWIAYTDGNLKRVYKNCISAFNRGNGWSTYDYKSSYPHAVYANILNCTAYSNGGFVGGGMYGYFIDMFYTSDTDENELKRTLKNNISYDNLNGAVSPWPNALYTHSHNSWDIPITLTDNDFVSLDSTGISGPRQKDGSLPVLNFLKLSSTSAAIDAGTDVGLDYNNAAPDLGFYEYPTFDEAVVPYLNTTYPTFSWSMGITSGGNMLDAGGGTISRKGICWSTDANPDINDNVVEGGVGTDDFTSKIWALKPNTTYHVRAFATNEYGTGYGADVEFTTPAMSFVMKNKKVIKLNGKIVII